MRAEGFVGVFAVGILRHLLAAHHKLARVVGLGPPQLLDLCRPRDRRPYLLQSINAKVGQFDPCLHKWLQK